MFSPKRPKIWKGRSFAAAFLFLYLWPVEAIALKCSEPDLNAELSRTDIAPVVLRGELSNVTPESAWYKPLKGPGFQVRPQRHSAGSFTPPLPVAGQDLILLADQDDKGFLINLHVCNATIFKADDAALAILRQHFPTLYE